MRLKLSLLETEPQGGARTRDIVVTADVTATIGELARTLVRAGGGDPTLLPHAVDRTLPLTVLVHRPHDRALVLDPADPIGRAGLRTGATIQVIREQDARTALRVAEPTAHLEVLDGVQAGARFTLTDGDNGVGRDRTNRVELHDRSVSRHHLVVSAAGQRRIVRDLGSANGVKVVDDETAPRPLTRPRDLDRTTVLRLGEVHVRIKPLPTSEIGRAHV